METNKMSRLIISNHPIFGIVSTYLGEKTIRKVLESKTKEPVTDKQIDDYGISLVPRGCKDARFFDKDALPDDFFIDAWDYNPSAKTVTLTSPAAKNEFFVKIRRDRKERFYWLDLKTARALGQNNTALIAEIESEKQVLRDLPETLNLDGEDDIASIKRKYPFDVLRVKDSDRP